MSSYSDIEDIQPLAYRLFQRNMQSEFTTNAELEKIKRARRFRSNNKSRNLLREMARENLLSAASQKIEKSKKKGKKKTKKKSKSEDETREREERKANKKATKGNAPKKKRTAAKPKSTVTARKKYDMKKSRESCGTVGKCQRTATGTCRRPNSWNWHRKMHPNLPLAEMQKSHADFKKILPDPDDRNRYYCGKITKMGGHLDNFRSSRPTQEQCMAYNANSSFVKMMRTLRDKHTDDVLEWKMTNVNQYKKVFAIAKSALSIANLNTRGETFEVKTTRDVDARPITVNPIASTNKKSKSKRYEIVVNTKFIKNLNPEKTYGGCGLFRFRKYDYINKDGQKKKRKTSKMKITRLGVAIRFMLYGLLLAKLMSTGHNQKQQQQYIKDYSLCYLGFYLELNKC